MRLYKVVVKFEMSQYVLAENENEAMAGVGQEAIELARKEGMYAEAEELPFGSEEAARAIEELGLESELR